MKLSAALMSAALFWIGQAAQAQPAAVSSSAMAAGGWIKQGSSLLFYNQNGELSLEIGLEISEDAVAGSRVSVREIRGDACPSRRFAWTLERTTSWNAAKTKVLRARQLLRVFGTNGNELWTINEADFPESGSQPVLFSDDCETLAIALRDEEGWTASVRTYLNNVIVEAGPFPRLEMIALTSNGRYATVRWAVPDQSATHTFIETATKRRRDIPSSELTLGLARIDEDGNVFSGRKLVFSFKEAP